LWLTLLLDVFYRGHDVYDARPTEAM